MLDEIEPHALTELTEAMDGVHDGGRCIAHAAKLAIHVARTTSGPSLRGAQALWGPRRIMRLFEDRYEAGRELAGELVAFAGQPDVVVLGLPRGGIPVAREVARRLGAPLDVFVVRKVGLPGHEELAMGAVARHGVV